jgi:chemotaxis methyl-accepting protein methylase/chemotaxis signal transduction protein
MTDPTSTPDLRVVVFGVGPTLFGLDCRAVQEVLPPLSITPLADAPGFIEGVVEVRGEVVPVIDLRPRLGGVADGFHRRTRLLLVRAGAGAVALIVDEVRDVRAVAADGLRPAPVSGPRPMVRGWIDAPGGPAIQLLDFDRMLSDAEADLLATEALVRPTTGDDERALDDLAGRLGEVSGLELNGTQRLRLTLAAGERARECGVRSIAEYAARLRGDGPELQQLLGRVVTGETYFFRNPAHFELLRRQVVPEALRTTPCVRVLSAACATGEEPYSIAMVLHEWVRQGRVEILAGDISETALGQARAASYERYSFRASGMDLFAPEVARWFTAQGERRQLDDQIRRAVRFAPLNLMSPRRTGRIRRAVPRRLLPQRLHLLRPGDRTPGRRADRAADGRRRGPVPGRCREPAGRDHGLPARADRRGDRLSQGPAGPRPRPRPRPRRPGRAARRPASQAASAPAPAPGPFARGQQAEARHDRTTAERE